MFFRICHFALLALLVVGCAATNASDSDAVFKERLKKTLKNDPAILAEVLKEHPEILLDVLAAHKISIYEMVDQGFLAKREEERQKQLTADLEAPLAPALHPARPMRGDRLAPITIVAYSDFLCPFCAKGSQTIKELQEKYPGKIRYAFKTFTEDKTARALSRIFEALALQDPAKAWRFHDLAFERQAAMKHESERVVDEILREVGANQEKLAAEVASPAIDAHLTADLEEGQGFKLRGTPNFLINGVALRGAFPLEEFERVIGLVEKKQGVQAGPIGQGEQCQDCEKDKAQNASQPPKAQ